MSPMQDQRWEPILIGPGRRCKTEPTWRADGAVGDRPQIYHGHHLVNALLLLILADAEIQTKARGELESLTDGAVGNVDVHLFYVSAGISGGRYGRI